jgi:lipopolysaccharide transport system ATP-binding protein
MTEPIVRVRGLSKRYLVGEAEVRTNSLREAVSLGVRRRLGRLTSRRERQAASAAREFWALSEVSFDVSPGQVLGVIGANGAGKSTLLKVLSRITEPTAGRVELFGRVASLLEVGTGFHPELTGRENVYLNGTLLGMRKREIDRKLDEIVAFSEVERFLDTPVKRYSSGMYVRLAFAVAAHLEPEILVVDEVLSVGDAAFQKKCLGKMDDIAHQGRTVLFVSHNMAAVQRLCTRAILLERGHLAAEGEPRAMAARYLAGEDRPRFEAARRTGRPQILSADLQDADGRPLARLVHTEPWTVEVRCALPEGAPGSRIGIGILSADGTPLFTTEAGEEGAPLPGEAGEFRARATLPGGAILAGDFHLAVCLWNEREILDLQEPALTFAVDPGPSHLYVSNPERKGFVHVPCRWSVDRA